MKQDVFIFGATGKVGSTLVNQILKRDGGKRRITGVASSKSYLYNPSGLARDAVVGFANGDNTGASYNGHDPVLDDVALHQDNPTCFVDATASTDIIPTHLRIVRDKFFEGMVTANKNPLIGNINDFYALTASSKYQYQCSVMAGGGAIAEVNRAYQLGDQIVSISGCFSGSLAYICDRMRNGESFSCALGEARSPENGLTEPDEREDLSGYDVVRKLLILARKAGYGVDLEDIVVEPFLPSEAFIDGESLESFRSRIVKYDSYFEKMITNAARDGMSIQYVASMWTPSVHDYLAVDVIQGPRPIPPTFFRGDFAEDRKKPLPKFVSADVIKEGWRSTIEVPFPLPTKFKVGIKRVPNTEMMASMRGTANGFDIVTKDRYPDGYFVSAAGAGLNVTAGNIRDDLNKLMS